MLDTSCTIQSQLIKIPSARQFTRGAHLTLTMKFPWGSRWIWIRRKISARSSEKWQRTTRTTPRRHARTDARESTDVRPVREVRREARNSKAVESRERPAGTGVTGAGCAAGPAHDIESYSPTLHPTPSYPSTSTSTLNVSCVLTRFKYCNVTRVVTVHVPTILSQCQKFIQYLENYDIMT